MTLNDVRLLVRLHLDLEGRPDHVGGGGAGERGGLAVADPLHPLLRREASHPEGVRGAR